VFETSLLTVTVEAVPAAVGVILFGQAMHFGGWAVLPAAQLKVTALP
jgi:hypothetical protein